MNLPFTSIELQSDGSWRFAWDTTNADYYRVVLYGTLLSVESGLTYTWAGQGYDGPPPIEVVDSGDLAESEIYRPRFVLQWYHAEGADTYTVEQLVGAAWTYLVSIGGGPWVITYTTGVLEDGTTQEFRVKSVDRLGNESDPLTFEDPVVRNPDPPDVTLVYTGAGTHQVQAAAT